MKKVLAIFLAAVTLLSVLFCCPISASATGEKITLVDLQHGTISRKGSRSFKFEVPARSKVTLFFWDFYEDDEDYFDDYETCGVALIRIKDSDGEIVFSKEAEFDYDGGSFTVTLERGDYTLTLKENESEDDYCYYDNEFEYCFYVTAKLLEDIQLTSLRFNKSAVTLSVGSTKALTWTQKPSNVSIDQVWFSSNEKVAVVDKTGKVTAKALGKAKITLESGNKSASCIVNVTANKKAVSVLNGNSVSIQKRFSNISGYKKAKWTSSDKKIATVNHISNGAQTHRR